MLIEFSIENFRSIKDEVTLSMLATSDKSLENNIIKNEKEKDRFLKSAAIYGANASGKTNVLFAFVVLKRLVKNSHKNQIGDKLPSHPFKLDEIYLNKPTKFEMIFIKNKIKYVYSISFNSEKVINEYLYYYPKGRRALIFNRENTNNYKFAMDRKELNSIKQKTKDNVLFLSSSAQWNYRITLEAFEWFNNDLKTINPKDYEVLKYFTVDLLNEDKEFKNLILKALYEADIGINDISAIRKKLSPKDIPSDFPSNLKDIILKEDMALEMIDINMIHRIAKENGEKIDINFDFESEESEGTKRLFSLIGPWLYALKNSQTLIVDELDVKLHHLLNEFLIQLFHDPTQNKNNAQLIFSTHNINLLDQNLFRRDQIWFTKKNPDTGSTDLYSLVEFSPRPRKDKDIKKGYLVGRYGALPFIKENRIF